MLNLPQTIEEMFDCVEEYDYIDYHIIDEGEYEGDNIYALQVFIELLKLDDYIVEVNEDESMIVVQHEDYDFLVYIDSYNMGHKLCHGFTCGVWDKDEL